MTNTGTVWAFDLGKGSIGEAVRLGDTFLHKASLLIPAEFAETKTAAGRRRMWRTRQAHKARERWLDEVMRKAGIEVLHGRNYDKSGNWKTGEPADKRLEREFAEPGDPTCYTSCLLRIKLLRGEKLEPWQIYKALHSAIQRRGYDPNIPWKTRSQRKAKTANAEDDEAGTQARMEQFEKDLEAMAPGKLAFQFPCYFDAWKMGLWNPADPTRLKDRIDCRAESTRNQIVPRRLVEKEIAALVDSAAAHYPKLKGQAKYLLFGPTETAYASFDAKLRKEHNLREGGANDWQGVLGQKIPRFDNRIIAECTLIPRYQVCAVHIRCDSKTSAPFASSLLPTEVTFLWKLKNMRFYRKGRQDGLTPKEIENIFEHPDPSLYRIEKKTWGKYAKEFKWDETALPAPIKLLKSTGQSQKRDQLIGWTLNKLREVRVRHQNEDVSPLRVDEITQILSEILLKTYALSPSKWAGWVENLGGQVLPAHEEVAPPKAKGRSRFSRPALGLLKEFIFAGLSPEEFREKKIKEVPENADAKKGLIRADLDCFRAERMGKTWMGAYIPNERLATLVQRAGSTCEDRERAICNLIGEQNNPIVRHRLDLFAKRIKELETELKFGEPKHVVLEFVRDVLPESFLSQEAQADYQQWTREKQKAAKEALEIVRQLGSQSKDAPLKYLLLKSQGFQCLYLPNGTLDFEETKQRLSESPCIYTAERIGITNIDDLVIDHIVPQQGGFNGPDSFINKVVTTRYINERLKKCRTPYQWFQQDMPDKWPAYVNRVRSLVGSLGKKKVRLLTQEDAPELVQKYTSLAETAWVSKLAQAILCIHFGWNFGADEERRRRITVVSGGLTARIRRQYGLDEILYPNRDAFLKAGKKKNRKDNRHHALDAMVISFIPGWASDTNKTDFFRLPEGVNKKLFERELQGVIPQNICFKKPRLEEKIYGLRQQTGADTSRPIMVRRLESIKDFPYKSQNQNLVFDSSFETAFERAKKLRDPAVRKVLVEIFEKRPSEKQWLDECVKGICLKTKDGTLGPRIKRVMLERGSPEEYHPISKDGKGYQRGEPHKGQIVYIETIANKKGVAKKTVQVRPVYAFESIAQVKTQLRQKFGDKIQFKGFFQSGCTIEVNKTVTHPTKPLPPGKYLLNTIRTDSKDVKVTTPTGVTHPEIPRYNLGNMLEAGLRRIEMDWDKQIGRDAAAGLLDKLASEANADIDADRLTPE